MTSGRNTNDRQVIRQLMSTASADISPGNGNWAAWRH
nr:MAG TPA: hypothetical protein [Caudoviricetes sp.]